MDHWISHWWRVGRKATPPMREIFCLQIYPCQAILSNFGFCGRKAPPPRMRENFSDFGSIHLRWFWATLVFVAEKHPPPPGWGEIFWLWIYPFQVILSKFAFCGWKVPPSFFSLLMRDSAHVAAHDVTSRIWSISGDHWASLWLTSWQKPPPPDEGNFSDFGSIHFRQFWASLLFVAERHPPPRMRENFLTLDLSISGDFEQVWFLWQKSPPFFSAFWWDTQLVLQHMM